MGMLTNMTHMQSDWDDAMLKLFWKFGESKWIPYWVIMLTHWSGTFYVFNEHEDVD